MIPPTNPKTKKALVFTSDTSAKHFFDKGNINMIKKECVNCIVYKYQGNFHTIVTKRERYWDEILTICCRACNQHSLFIDPEIHGNSINDIFIKKFDIKLKQMLGPEGYRKEKEKMREELAWMKRM